MGLNEDDSAWLADVREQTVQELADLLHTELCGDADPPRGHSCPRWRPDSSHVAFYRQRAASIEAKLEPVTGIANIIPVCRIVLAEVG